MQIGTADWSVTKMQNVCQRLASWRTVTTQRVIGAKDNLMFQSSLNNELYILSKISVLFCGMSYFNKNTKLSSAVPPFFLLSYKGHIFSLKYMTFYVIIMTSLN